MRLCDALEEKEMDLRLIDRRIAEGKLRPQDLEAHLKSLPDSLNNYMEMPLSPTPHKGPSSE